MIRLFLPLFACVSLLAHAADTIHMIQLESGPLSYKATAGTIPVKDGQGTVKGEIGYFAYLQEGASSSRPITFAFNGGPGSSSIWLHIAAIGPRRILSNEEGQTLTPPYQLVDNADTLLEWTDLVFIDPLCTGSSRVNSLDDAKPYLDVRGDIESISDFIYDFVTAHKRWNSPKYLAGESYGTTRACGIADYLQNEHAMFLNGLILISCAIDFQTFIHSPDNQLPYFLFLPSFAATAWHHGKYRPDASLEEVVKEANEFVYKEYVPAQIHRASLGKAEKETLYVRIAELTGLSFETVRRHQGRISDDLFIREFFGSERKILGHYDSRLVGDLFEFATDPFATDPSIYTISGIVGGAFCDYLQKELNFPLERYKILSMEANRNWNFFSLTPWGYPNLMNSLRTALLSNPRLKIFVASGYYDCVTPFGGADYCIDHLELPDSYRANIQMGYYEGGHMFYLNPSARTQFKRDLAPFYLKP